MCSEFAQKRGARRGVPGTLGIGITMAGKLWPFGRSVSNVGSSYGRVSFACEHTTAYMGLSALRSALPLAAKCSRERARASRPSIAGQTICSLLDH